MSTNMIGSVAVKSGAAILVSEDIVEGIYLEGLADVVVRAPAGRRPLVGQPGQKAIVLKNCQRVTIDGLHSRSGCSIGVHVFGGSHSCKVANLSLDRTADSGLIDEGNGGLTVDNVIALGCGYGPLTWGKHGMYLKGAGAKVTRSQAIGCKDSGFSSRREGIMLADCVAHSNGDVGFSFFDQAHASGTVSWTRCSAFRNAHGGMFIDQKLTAYAQAFLLVDVAMAEGGLNNKRKAESYYEHVTVDGKPL